MYLIRYTYGFLFSAAAIKIIDLISVGRISWVAAAYCRVQLEDMVPADIRLAEIRYLII